MLLFLNAFLGFASRGSSLCFLIILLDCCILGSSRNFHSWWPCRRCFIFQLRHHAPLNLLLLLSPPIIFKIAASIAVLLLILLLQRRKRLLVVYVAFFAGLHDVQLDEHFRLQVDLSGALRRLGYSSVLVKID